MEITLRNYQPFSWTKQVHNFAAPAWNRSANNFLEISKKITLVALGILFTGVVFAADLMMTGISLAYRAYSPIVSRPPMRPHFEAHQAKIKVTDNLQFMKDALDAAFSLLDEGTAELYKELIKDQGIPSIDCKEYVDIFGWCAGAYVIHFLRRSPRCDLSQIYPNNLSTIDHPQIQIKKDLIDSFNSLPDKEKNKITDKFFSPHDKINLSERTKKILHQIHAIAIEMTQDPHFIKEIYTPATTT